jgi:hypothetical protein
MSPLFILYTTLDFRLDVQKVLLVQWSLCFENSLEVHTQLYLLGISDFAI